MPLICDQNFKLLATLHILSGLWLKNKSRYYIVIQKFFLELKITIEGEKNDLF